MCGITGCFNFSEIEINSNEIISMVKALKHRGPNDNGVWQDQNVALGQTRLSIIDLKPTGHQPMISFDGNLYLFLMVRFTITKSWRNNYSEKMFFLKSRGIREFY